MVAATNEEQPTRALSYHAPERFADGDPSERGDIYAAGATIYYMLTGAPPYGKIRRSSERANLSYVSARSLREDFSGTLDDILARACAADPADRYPTVAPFAAALATVPIGSAPASSPTPNAADSPVSQGKSAWWFVAVLAAMLLGYLYFALR
jgi:serine/threonine protein kinase